MNSDSFTVLRSDYPSGHPFQTLALTGSTTAEQLFQVTNNTTAVVALPSQTAILGASAPMDPNANNAITIDFLGKPGAPRGGGRPYFNSGSFDGRAFRVRAMGKFNNLAGTTNAQTVTVKITSGNAVSSTKVIASVASATNVTSGNFLLEAVINWDSVQQTLYGEQYGFINATYDGRAVLSNTGITVAAYTSVQFCCSIVFATSSASSTANLVEFSMEQV